MLVKTPRSCPRRTPGSLRGAAVWFFVTTLGLCAAAGPAAAASAAAAVEERLSQGNEALDSGDTRSAIRAFEEADRLSDGGSVEARLALARAYHTMGAHKKVAEAAERALAIASEPPARAAAHIYLGYAFAEQAAGDRRPQEPLRRAESAFRSALELVGEEEEVSRSLLVNLGVVLLRLERDEEGIEVLERFLAIVPAGAEAERARSLIDDPRRAREPRLPRLELVTFDGDYLTEKDLAGKVVVLDFWATWCQPCHRAIPLLKELHRMSEKGEPVVVIGVSGDGEEGVVREFVAERGMAWLQVWDGLGGSIQSALDVTGYPTHLVVDHEGKILLRHSGWSDRTGASLRAAVNQAVRNARRADRRGR